MNDDQDTSLWDTAGDGDERGLDQEIVNQFAFDTLLERVEEVRFIFVTSYSDLRAGNGSVFI